MIAVKVFEERVEGKGSLKKKKLVKGSLKKRKLVKGSLKKGLRSGVGVVWVYEGTDD